MDQISRRSLLGIAIGQAFLVNQARAAFKPTPSLPDNLVVPAAKWLLAQFGNVFKTMTTNTPCTVSLMCAFACQESGYAWFRKAILTSYTPAQVLRLMVLDNNSPRSAYPTDSRTFLKDARFTDISPSLVKVSDASRSARGIKPTGQILFGYGLFQYDFQNILVDPEFWRGDDRSTGEMGMWGDISASARRFLDVFRNKYDSAGGNVHDAVHAYNGRGGSAEAYAEIVLRFERIIRNGMD